ncbi:MAG: hydroxyacylglutathione hydrolase [Burkholderiaceae bacterium]|nr:hydroxyacylglutathione hydrolase [Burkholderiaceae bacterium]
MVSNSLLQVWPIPAFTDNYIWCIHDQQSAILVDPGEAKPAIDYLTQQNLRLTGILITHYHADHIGGLPEILTWATQHGFLVPVYGPAGEDIALRSHALFEGDAVAFDAPKIQLQVLEVPGHTLGHIAYVARSEANAGQTPKLFCGDTLFASGCGRLFEGTPTQMSSSLAKFLALPPDTLVYCTHEYTLSNIRFALAVEPDNSALIEWSQEADAMRKRNQPTLPTTIAHEKRVNPFMRCDQTPVIAAARAQIGQDLKSPAEVLAVVRAWKDRF